MTDSVVADRGQHNDDQHTFYVGGNYDFGVTKVFALGQVFQNARELNGIDASAKKASTASAPRSARRPRSPAVSLTTAFYYANGDTEKADKSQKQESTYYGLAARYEYSLSKRTLSTVAPAILRKKSRSITATLLSRTSSLTTSSSRPTLV